MFIKSSNDNNNNSSNNQELHQNPLTTKQDDNLNKKFIFSRVLSKETSIANPSFRVYYGGLPGSVPFTWESQPGTPKYTLSQDTLPPLTPPPSYYSNTSFNKKPTKKNSSRSNLLHTLFPKISLKKTNDVIPSSPSSSPSASLFSASDSSMPEPDGTRKKLYRGSNRFSSTSSSFDSMGDYDHEEEDVGSPTSTLCFRFGRATGGGGCHRF